VTSPESQASGSEPPVDHPLRTATVELPAPVISLRRNRNFQLLWSGSALSLLGLFSAETAFILLILALTGSPGLTSLFTAVQTGVAIAVGLPAGRLLDRYDRRLLLVLIEAVRAAITASVVLAFWLDRVTLAHLLGAAVVLGGLQPLGSARMLLLRAAVAPSQLTSAVTAEEVRTNAAELAGPPLGGALFGVGHALPFLFSGILYVLAVVMALLLKIPRTAPLSTPGSSGMFSGLGAVLREPTMRAVVLVIMLINGIAWPVQLVAVVLLQRRGTPPWQIGLTVAGFALGGLAGAALVRWLHSRLSPGILLITVVAAEVPVIAGLSWSPGPAWTGLLCFAFGFGLPAIKVLIDVLIIRQIPDSIRGRALSGVITLFSLSVPAAMVATGLLLEYVTPAAAPLVLAGILLAGIAYAASRSTIRAAVWPADAGD
jgi:predicted MFS family arabinose efflux permease